MAKKNYVYGGKGVAVMEWLNKDPNASDAHIAKYVQCHPTYVKQIRKKMVHAQREEVKETVAGWKYEPEIDEVLTARHNNYGSFYDLSTVAQSFKNVMMSHLRQHDKHLIVDQQEALELIFTKVARILNGNPDNVDSWTDIAGYAKLVADRLQGVVR
jgi:hypothetical protein